MTSRATIAFIGRIERSYSRFGVWVWKSLVFIPALCMAQQSGPANSSVYEVHEKLLTETAQRRLKIGDVNFLIGNNFWLPGRRYANGSNWLALVCESQVQCVFESASLAVKSEKWQGHYDDKPTNGQRLRFRREPVAKGAVVAWMQPTSAYPLVAPGPVTAYSFARRTESPGTAEFTITGPNNRRTHFVPLLGGDSFFLQVRTDTRRQLLPGALELCSGTIPNGYLMWAGDLDGDSKPDFLVSYIDADGPVHLYLSNIAGTGQLVGLGGVFDSSPFGGECDGKAELPTIKR